MQAIWHPVRIYWYSYADTPSIAKEEGAGVVAKLKRFGVRASDLAYPVYYDLEKWTWKGRQPPTDPNVYNDIVNNWYGALQSAGYKNLGVYSYTSYLQGPLKHADIYAKTTWWRSTALAWDSTRSQPTVADGNTPAPAKWAASGAMWI